MAEKVTEKPVMDGPKPDEKGTEQTPEQKAAEMLETLEKLNIKDPQHIEGIVQTAQKFGPQAQELGEVRRMFEELKRENEALRTMGTQRTSDDLYGTGDNIDLGKIVYENQYKAVRDFWAKEIIEPQQKVQGQYFSELNEVQNDEYYGLVGEVFDKHLNSPQVQARIASGQTTVEKEYNKTVRSTLRHFLNQTQDALKGIVKPGEVKVPNVESQTQQPVLPTDDDERQEKLEKTIKARKAGEIDSDKAMEDIIKTYLNPDPKDPMFRFGD